MSKLKEFFSFGSSHKRNKEKSTIANEVSSINTITTATATTTATKTTARAVTCPTISADQGKLETDAVGVFDNDDNNSNIVYGESNSTTTSSSELTVQTVQQLVNDNNNNNNNNNNNDDPAVPNLLPTNANNAALVAPQNNMNVNNAQQQLVMHFNNANNVHFGAVYHIKSNENNNNINNNNNNKAKEMQIKHPITKKTPSIVTMMQSQIEPGVRILDTISTHLGEGWKQIMRDLGHTEGQIEQAIIDHQMHGNIREVIYQLLLQWVRSAEDNEATLGRITTLLWERKHHEVVHRMKIAWKDQQKQQQQKSQ